MKSEMTKEEFKHLIAEAGFDFEMFLNLTCFDKTTIYMWKSGGRGIPTFINPILNLLIALRKKGDFKLNDLKEKINTENHRNNKEQEIAYYKKAIALKKENDKLEKKVEKLKLKLKQIKELKNNEKPS